jgi:hypothetical protein
MASYADTVFENEVRKILGDKLAHLMRAAAEGTPQTLDKYREMVGEIRGVQVALDACDEARRLIVGEEPKTDALTRRRMATRDMGVV